MREYKFRGKIVDNGSWVKGSLLIENGLPFIFIDLCDKGIPNYFQVTPETVGQYTGLKDKNGKEIYEGDVIRYDDNKKWYASKTWEMYGLGMSFAEIDEHIAKLPPHTVNVEIPSIYEVSELNCYEIIGNIHDEVIK